MIAARDRLEQSSITLAPNRPFSVHVTSNPFTSRAKRSKVLIHLCWRALVSKILFDHAPNAALEMGLGIGSVASTQMSVSTTSIIGTLTAKKGKMGTGGPCRAKDAMTVVTVEEAIDKFGTFLGPQFRDRNSLLLASFGDGPTACFVVVVATLNQRIAEARGLVANIRREPKPTNFIITLILSQRTNDSCQMEVAITLANDDVSWMRDQYRLAVGSVVSGAVHIVVWLISSWVGLSSQSTIFCGHFF